MQRRFVDGADVLTRFDLHTSGAPPCPTVKWSHVQDGKITASRVTFDPRPLTEGDAAQGPLPAEVGATTYDLARCQPGRHRPTARQAASS